MTFRIIAGVLLASIAWSASSQQSGFAGQGYLGQGFAITGWSTPAAYGGLAPGPIKSQNRTDYTGDALLETVSEGVSGNLDAQLSRDLDTQLQRVDEGGPELAGD